MQKAEMKMWGRNAVVLFNLILFPSAASLSVSFSLLPAEGFPLLLISFILEWVPAFFLNFFFLRHVLIFWLPSCAIFQLHFSFSSIFRHFSDFFSNVYLCIWHVKLSIFRIFFRPNLANFFPSKVCFSLRANCFPSIALYFIPPFHSGFISFLHYFVIANREIELSKLTHRVHIRANALIETQTSSFNTNNNNNLINPILDKSALLLSRLCTDI